jgi:hypothetical protein
MQNTVKLFSIQSSSNCRAIIYLHKCSFQNIFMPLTQAGRHFITQKCTCHLKKYLDATRCAIGMIRSLWHSHNACIIHAVSMGIRTSTPTNTWAVAYPKYRTLTTGAHHKSMWPTTTACTDIFKSLFSCVPIQNTAEYTASSHISCRSTWFLLLCFWKSRHRIASYFH